MSAFFISLVQQYFTSLISSTLIIGVIYLLVFVIFQKKLAKWRVQKIKRVNGEQLWFEFKNSAIVLVVNILFSGLVILLKDNGYTQMYVDINQYGVPYLIFSFVLVMLIGDAWFYWFHRLLHHPKIYKYIHAVHHQSLDVNPFTANSFHIIEPLLLTLWIVPTVLIFPVSLSVIAVVQVVGTLNNIKSHLGYELYPKFFEKFPLNMLITSTNHNLHHTQYNGNYGLDFRFWDLVCGTEISESQQVFHDIREQKNPVIKDNTVYKDIVVSKIVKETLDTTSVYFEPTNPDFYDYLPGQYISIRVKINGKNYDRLFSLSSSPEDKFLRITVKLNGVVSHYIQNQLKVNDTIQALLPMGDFYLKPEGNRSTNYLMIAGGSGITPVFSMIKSLLNREPNSNINLFYANKSIESKIFAAELSELEKQFTQLTVADFISGQNRLSKSDIQNYLEKHPDSQIYVCGPDSLKNAVKGYLAEIGVDKTAIHHEDYVDGYVSFWQVLFGRKVA